MVHLIFCILSILLLPNSIGLMNLWKFSFICSQNYRSYPCFTSFGPYGTLFVEHRSISGGSCKWYCFASAHSFYHILVHLLPVSHFFSSSVTSVNHFLLCSCYHSDVLLFTLFSCYQHRKVDTLSLINFLTICSADVFSMHDKLQ